MVSLQSILLRVSMALVPLVSITGIVQAQTADGFPFGMEMTLDAAPKPGSKRIPNPGPVSRQSSGVSLISLTPLK